MMSTSTGLEDVSEASQFNVSLFDDQIPEPSGETW